MLSIFIDLSYSALMACTSCQVFLLILPPFEEVKVPVSNSADFFLKSVPWRILQDLGWLELIIICTYIHSSKIIPETILATWEYIITQLLPYW